MQHVVCYSGGHASALTAIEVARRFGTANLTLLNHDINASVEHADIKRFKTEVASYLGVPVTQADMDGVAERDQFDVCVEKQAFKVRNGPILCTHSLKTGPFMEWLAARFPMPAGGKDCMIYYGFDASEMKRIRRRIGFMAANGYRTDYPLALWKERTIASTREIGIEPPLTYEVFTHANCVGCLKAGLQHWYVVYCTRPDIWERGKWAEGQIGYSIHQEGFLEDLEPTFAAMKRAGVVPTEHVPPQKFWPRAKASIALPVLFDFGVEDERPCECVV